MFHSLHTFHHNHLLECVYSERFDWTAATSANMTNKY